MILKQACLQGYPKAQYAFKDSMIHGSAIHTTYRISLRSSSLREPRDPLSKVVSNYSFDKTVSISGYNNCATK